MDDNQSKNDDPNPPPEKLPPPVVKQAVQPPSSPIPQEELGEVEGFLGWLKALLMKPGSVAANLLNEKGPTGTTVFFFVFIICHLVYGLTMGLFSGESQLFWVPVKVLAGTVLGAILCYPSLFIFSCLSGADVSPGKVLSMLVGGLAMCSLLLVGFLPVSFIFTFSVKSVSFMGMVHLGVWLVSIFFACRYIRQGLLQGVPGANSFLYIWNLVLIVTLLQMSTTLRPLLGPADKDTPVITTEKKFFLLHWADSAFNALEAVED